MSLGVPGKSPLILPDFGSDYTKLFRYLKWRNPHLYLILVGANLISLWWVAFWADHR